MATPDEVPENRLGDYELLRLIHESDDVLTYEARQASVERTVALVLLKPHRCAEPRSVEAFRSEIRAKAAVNHPRIASVYEACEDGGRIYYTREVVEGIDLASLIESGGQLPLTWVLELVSAISESFQYYESRGLNYRALTAESVVLIKDVPYLANLATVDPSDPDVFRTSVDVMRHCLAALLQQGEGDSADVQSFFARMDPSHQKPYLTWQEIERACNLIKRLHAGSGTRSVMAASRAGSLVPGNRGARGVYRLPRPSWAPVWLALLLLLVVGFVIWWYLFRPGSLARDLDELVEIPSGEFIYRGGETKVLGDFWISKHEVTIADYAKFLESAGYDPIFDHEEQPELKIGHKPYEWDTYYPEAKRGGTFQGKAIDLNCPVMFVDWWDAYAYASWKGRRLPTAEEWEKAARGTEGNFFPWGTDLREEYFNSGLDYEPVPGGGGRRDGYNGWAPVDLPATDRSVYGVMGMAGNVMEWTSSPSEAAAASGEGSGGADDAGGEEEEGVNSSKMIVKGASFLDKEELELIAERRYERSKRGLGLGFRTVGDEPPD